MKIKLLAASLLIMTSVSFAQDDAMTSKNVTVTHSNGYEVVDAPSKQYFKTEDGIMSIKIRGKKGNEFIFQKFTGPKLNETKRVTKILDGPQFNVLYFKSLGFYEIGKKLQFLYSIYDKENTTEQLFALEVDTESGGFAATPISILTVNEKLAGSRYSQFSIDLSEDKEVVIIRYNYTPEVKDDSKNQAKIGMAVFGPEMDLIWKNDFQMPATEKLLTVEDFTVDSHGNGYFLLKKRVQALSRKTAQDPDNYSLSILKVDENGAGEETNFKIGDNIISSVVMQENGNGDIVCAGYYHKPKKYTVDGVFTCVLSQDGNLTTPSLNEFSIDFIQQYNKISDRADKKMQEKDANGELGMSNLRMRKVQVLADGSTLLTGEIFYITTYTDSKGNTHTTYHYNDVILTKINIEGEVDWMKKIPKRSTNESYRQFTSDNYIYVTFSDDPINAELKEDQTPKFSKHITVAAYRINIEDASHEYLTLFSLKKIDEIAVYQFNLWRIVPITDTEFAVEMYIKGKQDMMFKVEFDE